MKYWFTSDTHFNHTNILNYDDRPFSSIKEHDEQIIENWNSVVGKNDVVFHLGDFAFANSELILDYACLRLNGSVHLILGNHDKAMCKATRALAFEDVREVLFWRPPSLNQKIYMLHYPCISWDCSSHGSWHLHGHVHGRLKGRETGLSMDVGIMNNNYFPFSLEQVREHMFSLLTADSPRV
jgi:calcineurin-like phosphoesterase family protein